MSKANKTLSTELVLKVLDSNKRDDIKSKIAELLAFGFPEPQKEIGEIVGYRGYYSNYNIPTGMKLKKNSGVEINHRGKADGYIVLKAIFIGFDPYAISAPYLIMYTDSDGSEVTANVSLSQMLPEASSSFYYHGEEESKEETEETEEKQA